MATETRTLLNGATLRQRLGDIGREEQRRHYSWDAVTHQWEGLYQDLISS
jgi:glycosyltransferase involved in cell wall biosynthesis